MQYQFDEPFIVDSSKIATKLGVRATPAEQALANTLAAYRAEAPAPAPAPTARDQWSTPREIHRRWHVGPATVDPIAIRHALGLGQLSTGTFTT